MRTALKVDVTYIQAFPLLLKNSFNRVEQSTKQQKADIIKPTGLYY